MLDRLRDKVSFHKDFIMILLLYLSLRLMVLLLFRPGGFIADYSDYNTSYLPFAQWSNRGLYPFIDYWLEYPPLFPWLVVLVYRLSVLIPLWTEPRLWFNTLLGLSLLPFEVGSFVIIYLIALELYDQAGALRCAWIYAGLFAPLYTWMGWFDNMPLFFLLLGFYLLLKQRAYWAGIAMGLGLMTKFIPVLLLPIGFRHLRGLAQKLGFAVAAGIATFLVALPFLLINRGLFLFTAFRSLWEASAWETFWAVADGYFSYGIVGGDHLDPWTDLSIFQSNIPWFWTVGITLVFGLIYLWLYTRPQHREAKWQMVTFAGLTLNLFILYSRGYSPQFLVYVLPFIVLLLPNLRGVLYTILLTAINFLEGTAYFIIFPEERWLLVGTVFSRSALILALTLDYGLIFFSLASPRVKRIRDQAFWVLVVILLLVGCAAVYPLSKAYVESRYAQEGYRPVIELLRTEAEKGTTCLVLTDPSLYPRFYPWLRKDMDLYLVEDEKHITEATTAYNELWLFRGSKVTPAVKEWLEKNAQLVSDYDFDQGQLLRYAVR